MKNSLSEKRADLLTDMSVAGRKLRTLFDAFAKEHDMTLPRARTLFLLSKNKCMTQTELAAALEIETPTLVRLLDGLEKQGMVTRRVAEDDRRAKHIELADNAHEQVAELQQVAEHLRIRVLQDLSEQDLDEGIRILRIILKNMEAIS
ncbi:MarR family winged helix-turn-helix transcriptional regulator [Pseudochrobactrum sp. MP213Fo]|uniref:MarR family winged helix-turn-helix transcriptional regulator n=1 Tax=Pseudochrobactrum sp. MP213Fo TaxID=3022250 RepID=UPI003BA16CB2